MCKTCETKVFPSDTDGLSYNGCKRKVIKLPSPLPEGLQRIYFSNCLNLTRPPDGLPEDLEYLSFHYCPSITSLPDPLPEGLGSLNCCGCKSLTSLPKRLPEGLESLDCGCTGLTRLPEHLPKCLKRLDCRDCTGLTHLPENLSESLKYLNLGRCKKLTRLPECLPEGLEYLKCRGCTGLTHLPDSLPERLELICKDCPLLLSDDPEVLEQIDIDANRKRHLEIKQMEERLLEREREKWTLMCLALGCEESPVKYLCTDVLQIIHSYNKEHLHNEYTQNISEIVCGGI